MANESVGQIGLDLVVNEGSFHKQMNGLQRIAAKAGKTLAAAFAVKKLVDFGKQCVELGSDLQEVQNVVDVTFPKMKKQVNSFARNAASSFGLSETMAKRFTGTFGAMAKAFGFNEESAYEMSAALTGLAGDIASFYNISQDEAYTKLKSVFTGETESLKDLGVVMTQTALDNYALANGFGKTTKSMSEAEKVALRYKFVLNQLSAASGDFDRTSGGWANQIRVLKLQFDSLKASIGQGLINALTPVIQVINAIIAKLVTLADYFRAFTEALFGKAGSSDVTASIAENVESAAVGMGKTAAAAEKTKKALSVAGFDELNLVSSQGGDSDSGSGGGGGGASIAPFAPGNVTVPDIDTSGVTAAAKRIKNTFRGLREFVSEHKRAILATIGGLVSGIAAYFVASNWDKLISGALGLISKFKGGFITALTGISPAAVGIAAVVGVLVAAIIDLWNTSEGFRDTVKTAWSMISSAFKTGWELIWNQGLKPLGGALSELGSTLYTFYESSGLKKLFGFVMSGVTSVAGILGSVLVLAVSSTLTVILQAITSITTGISSVVEKVTWLAKNWKDVFNSMKEQTAQIFRNIWSTIKAIINSIIGGVEKMANSVISTINKLIGGVNTVAKMAPWIEANVVSPLSPIKLPRLAQGGYVKANTPQLAMIGDNRRYGEIVAPEDKLLELLKKAVTAGSMTALAGFAALDEETLYRVIKRALEDADFVAMLDSDSAFKAMQAKAEAYRKRTGKPAFTY